MRSTLIAIVLALLAIPAVASAAPADGAPGKAPNVNWISFDYGEGATAEPGETPYEGPPLLLVMINFGILLILLGWKAVPPLKRYADRRHVLIKDALEEASKLREEARRKLDEYNDKIKDVETEVDQLIAGIRADAEAEKKRIIAEAERQAAALERDAQNRIAADIERARTQLEREVTAAAIAAAEKILREHMTPSDQQKLVAGFIGDLAAPAAGATPGGPR
jgi:F-type H+-transporting ATPase subunit b